MNWIPIIGSFECDNGDVVFKGGNETTNGEPGRALGNALCEEGRPNNGVNRSARSGFHMVPISAARAPGYA